jgi:hypothetical protein
VRDAARIPEVLEALRRAWEANPDLRLGQLVTAAAEEHYSAPVFYTEDDVMLEGLKKLIPVEWVYGVRPKGGQFKPAARFSEETARRFLLEATPEKGYTTEFELLRRKSYPKDSPWEVIE